MNIENLKDALGAAVAIPSGKTDTLPPFVLPMGIEAAVRRLKAHHAAVEARKIHGEFKFDHRAGCTCPATPKGVDTKEIPICE